MAEETNTTVIFKVEKDATYSVVKVEAMDEHTISIDGKMITLVWISL
jgi:hypothetical protein